MPARAGGAAGSTQTSRFRGGLVYNFRMATCMRIFRFLAVVLLIVVVVTVAKPARAEADVLTAIGIASLVVIAVLIVAYLVAANMSEASAEPVPHLYAAAAADAP